MVFDNLVSQLYEQLEQYYNSEDAEGKKVNEAKLRQACLDVVRWKVDEFPIHYITILSLVASGLRNKDIAEKLELSTRTITNYLSIIYHYLGVNNRTEAVIRAVHEGIITLDNNTTQPAPK